MTAPKTTDNSAVFNEIVDHDLIFNQLRSAIRPNTHHMVQAMGATLSYHLSELRTIGWEATRQQGSTQWIIQQMAKDKTALMVTVNANMREIILRRLPSLRGRVLVARAPNADRDVLPHVPMGQYIYIDGRLSVIFGTKRRKFFDWATRDSNLERIVVVVGK